MVLKKVQAGQNEPTSQEENELKQMMDGMQTSCQRVLWKLVKNKSIEDLLYPVAAPTEQPKEQKNSKEQGKSLKKMMQEMGAAAGSQSQVITYENTNLTRLVLSRLDLSGTLSKSYIGELRHLVDLQLQRNNLTGDVPWEGIKRLSNLKTLGLGRNPWAAGGIPEHLPGAFPVLEQLWLHEMNLTGPVPADFVKFNLIKSIDLRGNQLSGMVPKVLLSAGFTCKLEENEELEYPEFVSFDLAQFKQYFIPRDTVMGLEELPIFEDALAKGQIVPSTQRDDGYASRIDGEWVEPEKLAFFSQRWLRGKHPDCKFATKLKVIKRILQHHPVIMYIWIDISCIPQRSSGTEGQRAIRSLPFYIQSCKNFFTLEGNGVVTDGKKEESTFEIYRDRGWCRLEILTGHCLQKTHHWKTGEVVWRKIDMYIVNKDNEQYTERLYQPDDLPNDSINPLAKTANFWAESDKFKISPLVKTVIDRFREMSLLDQELKRKHDPLPPGLPRRVSSLKKLPTNSQSFRNLLGKMEHFHDVLMTHVHKWTTPEGEEEEEVQHLQKAKTDGNPNTNPMMKTDEDS